MIRQGVTGAAVHARRLTLITLVMASGALLAAPASARPGGSGPHGTGFPDDGQHNSGSISMHGGNGRANRNFRQVLSHSTNSGRQQIQNANISGRTNTQLGFCRKKNCVCRIRQRLQSH
ncbi:hypothetical protein ACRYCC_05230 [Actinomadura scrupuli]|uniref:hypothetical protein n=1 Tax=Actinomadura scrupuli TaxID=559629 RepID=UPI003D99B20F